MLKYTKQQAEAVINERRVFNESMKAMAPKVVPGLEGNASPLPKDVWGEWDREGIEVQRNELAVFNSLAANTRAMPIGKLVHHFQQVTDSGEINISLDGTSMAKGDQPNIAYVGTPLPIIDTTFRFGWRQMAAAQSEGYSIDNAAVNNAQRRIAEKLESIALDGDDKIDVGGAKLYGLRNHPKRSARTTGQALNGATGAEWNADVVATLQLLHAKNYRVPATLYLNWDDWFYASSTDFSTQYPNKKILDRIMEIPGVKEIVPASQVTAGQIIAVVKEARVVQVLNGMPMTTRPLSRANPTDDYAFRVMAAAAVEIKYDSDDNCGVAVSSL